jgi:hypothetical protein
MLRGHRRGLRTLDIFHRVRPACLTRLWGTGGGRERRIAAMTSLDLDRPHPADRPSNWIGMITLALAILTAIVTGQRVYSDANSTIAARVTAVETRQTEVKEATNQRLDRIDQSIKELNANLLVVLQRR